MAEDICIRTEEQLLQPNESRLSDRIAMDDTGFIMKDERMDTALQLRAPTVAYYYKFKIDHKLPCNHKLREEVNKSLCLKAFYPLKSGEGKRFTDRGVLETSAPVGEQIVWWDCPVSLSKISRKEFESCHEETQQKVFFRGFPNDVKRQEVKKFFEPFGKVQYIYFMCEPKSRTASSKMGYVIFDVHESVEALLAQKNKLYYNRSTVYVDLYSSNRKKPKTALITGILASEFEGRLNPKDSDKILKDKSSSSGAAIVKQPRVMIQAAISFEASRAASLYTQFANVLANSLDPTNLRFNIKLPKSRQFPTTTV